MGNSYNWIASIATNTLSEFNTSTFNNISNNPKNSLCPKGWRLPIGSSTNSEDDFVTLGSYYPTPNSSQNVRGIMEAPLYFLRGGVARGGTMQYVGGSGSYYTSTSNGASAVNLDFMTTNLQLNRRDQPGWRGREIRCVAR